MWLYRAGMNVKKYLPQRRTGDTEKKIQCGVYFAHGNTVAKINATLLGGRPEREERVCVL
jgi:hypothetical protein